MVPLFACTSPATTNEQSFIISIKDNSQSYEINVTPGITVQMALSQAGLTLSPLDRTEPPSFTILSKPIEITIIRVSEEFQVIEETIPFTQQQVRNESLPAGQQLLIQSGINGIQQLTYRQVSENGQVVSRNLFKVITVLEARPEIIMIGVQAPFVAAPIEGKVAYLTGGNAWMMETTTGNRKPLVTTGDLDGRIFSLSPDGSWLLFTRKIETEESINQLWVVNTSGEPSLIDLGVSNVIHFADWEPDRTRTVTYSTVEPRSIAPGWQANNDLWRLSFTEAGSVTKNDQLLEATAGGIYGWWGTTFQWSHDGQSLAYARPDSVGLVNLDQAEYVPVADITPFRTGSDWAWVPPMNWSIDNSTLYYVTHGSENGNAITEDSPRFDLEALILNKGTVTLNSRTGMFALPVAHKNWIGYLQSVFPDQSDTSRYKLMVMDRDGSNKHQLFPPEGSTGIDPQTVAWQPNGEDIVAFIYQGNLYLVNVSTSNYQQITGDGLISNIDWK
jgi:hypothetical protein